MEATYHIPTDEIKLQKMLEKVTKKAGKENITIHGDKNSGTFFGTTVLGRIAGTYKTDIKQGKLTVTLQQKPSLVPSVILRKAMAGVFGIEQ